MLSLARGDNKDSLLSYRNSPRYCYSGTSSSLTMKIRGGQQLLNKNGIHVFMKAISYLLDIGWCLFFNRYFGQIVTDSRFLSRCLTIESGIRQQKNG